VGMCCHSSAVYQAPLRVNRASETASPTVWPGNVGVDADAAPHVQPLRNMRAKSIVKAGCPGRLYRPRQLLSHWNHETEWVFPTSLHVLWL